MSSLLSAVVIAALAGCATSGGDASPAPSASGVTGVTGAPAVALPEPIPSPAWSGDAPGELSGEVVGGLLRFRDEAPGLYPDNYAGVASGTPESKDVLVIFLAGSTTGLEQGIRSSLGLPPEKLRFERAYQSAKAAAAVDARIKADYDELRAEGIEILSFGVNVDGVEDLGLDHPGDEQVAALFERYGPFLRIDREATVASAGF
ncbi:hypothetical protein [Herbiconiux sp. YIM B11900]|uniref:hypothetical protein n=1 Tax=Herbiconiux sp. YIM B11900 TaxID=3404131 RepID=UPI003F8748E2